MSGVSNEGYLKRADRLQKIGELMETGIPPRDIAKQLCVQYSTVRSDIEVLHNLSKGSLSPEITAEKRIEIDKSFLELDDEAYRTYTNLLEDGKHKMALEYMKVCVDLRKHRAKLWGLDQSISISPNVMAENVNFTKFNVDLSQKDVNRMREIALNG